MSLGFLQGAIELHSRLEVYTGIGQRTKSDKEYC